MSIQHYQHLRACELEAALLEAKEDRQAGRIIDRTIAEHIADLKKRWITNKIIFTESYVRRARKFFQKAS